MSGGDSLQGTDSVELTGQVEIEQHRVDQAIAQHVQLPRVNELTTSRQFEKRQTLEDRSARDAEELLAIGFREPAVAFGKVGGDGYGCAVELIGEEAVAAGEVLGGGEDLVGEVDGLLVDDEVLDDEGHPRRLRSASCPHGG